MKSFISSCLIATLLHSALALAGTEPKAGPDSKAADNKTTAEATKEQYATCSGYYFVLSIPAPKFVNDLTHDQAVKASFAMLKKVNPDINSPEATKVLTDKMTALSDEIPRPMSQEGIDAFRKKYDGVCRPLLKQAWCDAYGSLDRNACAG